MTRFILHSLLFLGLISTTTNTLAYLNQSNYEKHGDHCEYWVKGEKVYSLSPEICNQHEGVSAQVCKACLEHCRRETCVCSFRFPAE